MKGQVNGQKLESIKSIGFMMVDYNGWPCFWFLLRHSITLKNAWRMVPQNAGWHFCKIRWTFQLQVRFKYKWKERSSEQRYQPPWHWPMRGGVNKTVKNMVYDRVMFKKSHWKWWNSQRTYTKPSWIRNISMLGLVLGITLGGRITAVGIVHASVVASWDLMMANTFLISLVRDNMNEITDSWVLWAWDKVFQKQAFNNEKLSQQYLSLVYQGYHPGN